MLDERDQVGMNGADINFSASNNITEFPKRELEKPKVLEPLDEAKEMHRISIHNLADHLHADYNEIDKLIAEYVAIREDREMSDEDRYNKTKDMFDKSDERVARMLNSACKSYSLLRTRLNQESNKSMQAAA